MTCEAITAELNAPHTDLTALAQLVAIYAAAGITSAAELARRTGYSERAVRKAAAELRCRNQGADAELGCRNPSTESGTPVPERNPSAGTWVPEPSRAHATKESLRDTSYQDNRQTDSREVSVSQSAFNQTSENLIADAARWMNSDRSHAVKWLTTMIGIAGPDAVLAAYAQLLESQSKGKLIADPIRYIGKTAPTLKGKAQPKAELEIDGKPFRVTGHRFARPREEVMGNA